MVEKSRMGAEMVGKGKKGPDTNATPSVIYFSHPQSLDRKIYVLGGTNLREIRGCFRLSSPGVIEPALDHTNRSGGL